MSHNLHTPTERRKGLWLIILSACAFGGLPLFVHLAYRGGADIYGVLMLRYLLAGSLLFGVALKRRLPWPSIKGLIALAALGGIGYVGQSYFYFLALEYAPASLVALLLYTYPIIVTLLAAVFLQERLSWVKLAVLSLCVAGAGLTVSGPISGLAGAAFPQQSLGVMCGLSAALIYAFYILAGTRITRGINPVVSTALICLSAALTFVVVVSFRAQAGHAVQLPESASGWAGVLGVTLVSTVIAVLAFFAGLKRLGASNASMLSALEPVVTVLLASTLLGESLSPTQWCGGALILGAVVWLAQADRRSAQRTVAQPIAA